MIKKVEVLANIAVIITSVILCTIVAKKHLVPSSTPKQANITATQAAGNNTRPRRTIEPGTKISIAGIDWSQSDRTVLLALSTTCHFCTESAPFYRKLQEFKSPNIRLVAVLPQPVETGGDYLDGLGVSVSKVVQAPLASVAVSATPTLMVIDRGGFVRESWIGKLSDSDAEKVFGLLTTPR